MKKALIFGLLSLLALLSVFIQAPAGQAAPPAQLTVFPTPTPGPDGKIIYIVQEKDTLWRISAITGVSLDELRTLNKMGPDDPIRPGDRLLIGLAGPASASPTPGPSPTPEPLLPTTSPLPGWGVLCVLLYNDVNGDSLRQEEEPSIPGGAISISDRQGRVSITAETPSGGVTDLLYPEAEDLGYTCFPELPEGELNVTVAIPEGYNPTTRLSYALAIHAGDESLLAFGAQANSKKLVETAIIPETPGRSPLLGIIGGLILLVGLGLGIYSTLLRRGKG